MDPGFRKVHPSLPIFRIAADATGRSVLYTPGAFIEVEDRTVERALEWWRDPATTGQSRPDVSFDAGVRWIESEAEKAVARWRERSNAPFEPVCLLLYLTNRCNLACRYCFSSSQGRRRVQGDKTLDWDAVKPAAEHVLNSCRKLSAVFRLVIHGGGEPTLYGDVVSQICAETKWMAAERSVEWHSYLATNGVLPVDQARRLAGEFTVIGLSCDGPPDVQNGQRPRANGSGSSSSLLLAAAEIARAGGTIEVRSTITPATVNRQAEIAEYLLSTLAPRAIRFEPVYRDEERDWRAEDADVFVGNFIAAQEVASKAGCQLSYSGVRLDELHGPHCSPSGRALHILPGGQLSGCFFLVEPAVAPGLLLGSVHGGELLIDEAGAARHIRLSRRIDDRCTECINVFHCARRCPDECHVRPPSDGEPAGRANFRCRINRRLAVHWVQQAAARARRHRLPALQLSRGDDVPKRLIEELRRLPQSVDSQAVLAAYEAASPCYSLEARGLPLPEWSRRGYRLDGAGVWRALSALPSSSGRPISIYIHCPYCDRRCSFCDCLSRPSGRGRALAQGRFVFALVAEMRRWAASGIPSGRPVTTVHFGGGTPNSLSPELFAGIVDSCKQLFSTDSVTEWALESTGSLLTEERLDWLRCLGFTRLHVGVQTLEEEVRRLIGRRGSSELLLSRIGHAVGLGLVTSVDLIYGLPGETPSGFIRSIERLIDSGVHGFSLYRFNRSARNRAFLRKTGHRADATRDYVLFQAAHQVLVKAGYTKNHFAHFARPEDKNLYYTYRRRGEELLALGPTADGILGGFCYRHHDLERYLEDIAAGATGLEGGLPVLENSVSLACEQLAGAIMGGSLETTDLQSCPAVLISRWTAAGLIERREGGALLTANGSWFVSRMLDDLRSYFGQTT